MNSGPSLPFMRRAWLRFLLTVAAFSVALAAPAHAARQLSLPATLASPGMLVQVPVILNDAAGLASVRAAINFDSQLLEFQGVARGPLGAQFELTPSAADGVLLLLFTRDTNLSSGSGRLAILTFRVHLGAETEAFSSLAIAEFQVGDESGVLAMDALSPLLTQNGRVTVSSSLFIDNDADALPDRWETGQGLSMLDPDTLSDPDGDGVPNLAEYAQGLDPLRGNQAALLPFTDTVESASSRFLSLSFRRLLSPPPGLSYSVEESSDLTNWTELDSATYQLGPGTPQGDGTERVIIRGTLPISGPNAQPKAFLHLRIENSSP
jgi:hypothetical protein